MKRLSIMAVWVAFVCFGVVLFAREEGNESEPAPVYVIPLKEGVERYLGILVGRSIETAREAGATTLIFEIDTFGGRLDTALEIASKIGAASWARTVAYIPADDSGRGVSWSAGALIAFASSEIWMAPGTSMGAATPVVQSPGGLGAADEKILSAVRGQIAALAEKNSYPVSVAVAMVDPDVELLEVAMDGVTRLLTPEDIEELKRRQVSYTPGRKISGAGKLLTLTAGEMEKYGVSSGSVDTRDELVKRLGYELDDLFVITRSGADAIVTFLSSGVVTSLLVIIGLVGIYLEVNSPGFGISGVIALISFAIIFSMSNLTGNLGAVEVIMFIIGVILLLFEIFIIPGFGVAGISGLILIVMSLVFARQDFYLPDFEWQWGFLGRNVLNVFLSILISVVLIAVLMFILPKGGLLNRLVLGNPGDPGYGGSPVRRLRHGRKSGRR